MVPYSLRGQLIDPGGLLGKMLVKLTGQPIGGILTDVARRAGLTHSALQAPEVTKMPEPASHGYVAATGAKELGAVGVTLTPGTDVSNWTVSWGQAGGGMYSTIADLGTWAPGHLGTWAPGHLGTWAGSGLGTRLLPADVATKRLAAQKIPQGNYGLGIYGIYDWGQGWVWHTGQLIGWESVVAYNTRTGAAFVAIVNETSSFMTAMAVGLQVFPDHNGLLAL